MSTYETTFEAMGTHVRLIIGRPLDATVPPPAFAAADAQRWVADYARRMSRFRADSELSALNADPRETVPASPLLRATVGAALWAARQTGGLVDPTLVGELERAGYASSRAGTEPASLADAIAAAPPRAPAAPSENADWQLISVDDDAATITRPPDVRIDSGGAGKGLAADALAHRLHRYWRVAIDCGGDVRVAGPASNKEPFEIEIEHPLTHEPVLSLALGDGAIATSGLSTRIWQTSDGGFAHHLIDPATGRPAWTGLIQATAVAPTALEAETLAKAALLSGPDRARAILSPLGGALVHDDGDAEFLGALRFEEVAA